MAQTWYSFIDCVKQVVHWLNVASSDSALTRYGIHYSSVWNTLYPVWNTLYDIIAFWSIKVFQPEFHLKYFCLCVKVKKLHFPKVIVFTYADTVKYRAVEKNDVLQWERGLTHTGLKLA